MPWMALLPSRCSSGRQRTLLHHWVPVELDQKLDATSTHQVVHRDSRATHSELPHTLVRVLIASIVVPPVHVGVGNNLGKLVGQIGDGAIIARLVTQGCSAVSNVIAIGVC